MTDTTQTAPAARPMTDVPYADVVDLERYPIHDLASAEGQRLVASGKAELEATGVCNLAGFIRPGAVARMVELAGELSEKAWPMDRTHTVYFERPDEG
ncbi:MAG TPA: hypothetical protein VFL99_07170, partial [Segeticoccus sp.]|nr:hypothetical protein [Segeticoccus sp.]